MLASLAHPSIHPSIHPSTSPYLRRRPPVHDSLRQRQHVPVDLSQHLLHRYDAGRIGLGNSAGHGPVCRLRGRFNLLPADRNTKSRGVLSALALCA